MSHESTRLRRHMQMRSMSSPSSLGVLAAAAPGQRELLTEIAALDQVLQIHAASIGRDFDAYRNHTYRLVNFCFALATNNAENREKVALAAAFHDIGIWTDGTWDYLEPSVRAATVFLSETGRSAWIPEIATMIRQHHKITRWRGEAGWLVEPFRKADWVDVSRGLVSHGVPRRLRADVFARWPDRGFHWRLVLLTLGRLRGHPLSPLPMLRL